MPITIPMALLIVIAGLPALSERASSEVITNRPVSMVPSAGFLGLCFDNIQADLGPLPRA